MGKLFVGAGVVWLITVAALVVGWTKNILFIIGMENIDFSNGETIVRFVGIPLGPLGAIMGWFF